MEDKELDIKFFKSLNRLLREYIKSEDVSRNIYKTVKNICKLDGYRWEDIKYNLDGTDYYPSKNEIIYLKKQLEYYKSLSEL